MCSSCDRVCVWCVRVIMILHITYMYIYIYIFVVVRSVCVCVCVLLLLLINKIEISMVGDVEDIYIKYPSIDTSSSHTH